MVMIMMKGVVGRLCFPNRHFNTDSLALGIRRHVYSPSALTVLASFVACPGHNVGWVGVTPWTFKGREFPPNSAVLTSESKFFFKKKTPRFLTFRIEYWVQNRATPAGFVSAFLAAPPSPPDASASCVSTP